MTNGYSNNQFNFTLECLKELNEKLGFINAKIHIFEGNLSKLKIWIERSHPECLIHINLSTDIYYYRELLFNFKKYFHKTGRIKIYENFGIQIKNYNREIWSKNWFRIMTTVTLNSPLENRVKITSTLPTLEQFSESLPKIREAGLGIVPTSSTSIQLAIGDALAIAALNKKRFNKYDFSRLHPAGNLGKQLMTVEDLMVTQKKCLVLLKQNFLAPDSHHI